MLAGGGTAYEDHLSTPRGRGRLTDAGHAGAAGGAACGDVVRVAIRVDGERVVEAGFDARGCAAATAAGSAVVELVDGATVLDAGRVGPEQVDALLGGLSPARRHAAGLAADALHRALGAAVAAGAARLTASSRRTLVAMSGGVDSAVAALLARARGDEVIGVTLELWSDPAGDPTRSCCSPQAVTGARALAHRLGLPHLTLDLREAFRAEVVDDFIAEHRTGRTPNPCVRCNGIVRFAEMLSLAGALGAARLATGHYARLDRDEGGVLLRAAADPRKDQTYMLARLAPEALARLDFPLGEMTKPDVRAAAAAAGLAEAERPESQDLCFLSGLGREAFLRRHGGPAGEGRPGEIVDLGGRVIGAHLGQERFTVGQRRGIGVAGTEPLYVVSKDARANRVTVGPREALATRRVLLRDAVLHRAGQTVDRVKLRYKSAPLACTLEGRPGPGRHRALSLRLPSPVDGASPGQTACLLSGDRVVGAALIDHGGND